MLQAFYRSRLFPALVAYLAFIPAVGVIPYLVPPAGNVSSAGTAWGYNNTFAYRLTLMVAISTIGVFAFGEWRRSWPGMRNEVAVKVVSPTLTKAWVEPLAIFALFILLYYPGFLALHGPYNEDNYFLTVLHRMNGGMRPYRDFEFPYGPLMVYMANAWMVAFGYSMRAYYGLICVLEALQFSLLIVLLRRWIPGRISRFLVFGFLSVFLFDTLLGLNWNGLRRLLPAGAILCAASAPESRLRIFLAGALCGLSIAYSPDLGTPCVIAGTCLYLYGWLRTRQWIWARRAGLFLMTSLAAWLTILVVLLGHDLQAYLRAGLYVLQRFGAGEAGFPFFWTLNSLAVFALISYCCVAVGIGLGNRSGAQPASGDFLFLSATCFALLGMRSGLNRADMWHLNGPLLPLFLAFIAPWPRSIFGLHRGARRTAIAILVVLCLSYIPGILPSGSFYFAGWFNGLRETLAARTPTRQTVASRAPLIEVERSLPDSGLLAMASYLAAGERHDRPVVFYNEAWSSDKRVGVYKTGYPTDDVLLDDAAGERVRSLLEGPTGAFVVLTRDEYLRVYGKDTSDAPPPSDFYSNTPAKALASWVSTVHFRVAEVERSVRQRRWNRTIGTYLKSHYVLAGDYGEYVLLAPGSQA